MNGNDANGSSLDLDSTEENHLRHNSGKPAFGTRIELVTYRKRGSANKPTATLGGSNFTGGRLVWVT